MARDLYHEHVRTALLKEGWTITDDPLSLKKGRVELEADLGAERWIAAERGVEKIAVEIKSFRSDSFIYDLHEALGQYLIYQPFLERKEPTRLLFLAVPLLVYEEYFSDEDIEFICREYHLRLVVFNPTAEKIALWIR